MDIVTHWRLKEARYRLKGMSCPICGERNLPLRPICPRCGSQAMETMESKVFKSTPIPQQALALLSKGEEVKR